jgi:hypothetical protein
MTQFVANLVLRSKPQSTFCVECETFAPLRHAYLGSLFLDPEKIRVLGMGPSGTLLREQGSYRLVQNMGAQRACQLRPRCIGPERDRTQYYSILFYCHRLIFDNISRFSMVKPTFLQQKLKAEQQYSHTAPVGKTFN